MISFLKLYLKYLMHNLLLFLNVVLVAVDILNNLDNSCLFCSLDILFVCFVETSMGWS